MTVVHNKAMLFCTVSIVIWCKSSKPRAHLSSNYLLQHIENLTHVLWFIQHISKITKRTTHHTNRIIQQAPSSGQQQQQQTSKAKLHLYATRHIRTMHCNWPIQSNRWMLYIRRTVFEWLWGRILLLGFMSTKVLYCQGMAWRFVR